MKFAVLTLMVYICEIMCRLNASDVDSDA